MTDYTNALDLVAKIRAQEVTPERVAMVKEAQAEGVAKVAAIRTKHENNADRGEIMEIKIPFGAYVLTGIVVKAHVNYDRVLITSAEEDGWDARYFHLIGKTISVSTPTPGFNRPITDATREFLSRMYSRSVRRPSGTRKSLLALNRP